MTQPSPTVYKKRAGTASDPYVLITEQIPVTGNRVELSEIPDSFSKVQVLETGYFEKPTPTSLSNTEYYVDYIRGHILFNPSTNGATLTFKYYGTGSLLISSARIFDERDVGQTLDDLVGSLKASVPEGIALFRQKSQTFISTASQRTFTLTEGTYVPGNDRLQVFVSGAKQSLDNGSFTEDDSAHFTLSVGVPSGTIVEAVWLEGVIVGPADTENFTLDSINSIIGLNIEDFPKLLGEYDDTGRINRAIDRLRTNGGGILKFTSNKVFRTSGNHILPSNCSIEGAGSNTVIQLIENTYACVIKTVSSVSNVSIRNLTIDGNYSGLDNTSVQLNFHSIFFKNVNGLTIENITVRNPVAWCARIDTCNDVMVNNFRAFSTGHQMDGIHFVDCNKVRGSNIYGETGDDVLGVTADYKDLDDHQFNNVSGKSLIGSLVRLNQSDRSVGTGIETRAMRNMHFTNLYGFDCGNRGFSASTISVNSILENFNITGIFKNCGREGIRIDRGSKGKIFAVIEDCGTGVTRLTTTEGIKTDSALFYQLDNSKIELIISNVQDGCHGATFNHGKYNSIWAEIDYRKSGKPNPKSCINLEDIGYSSIIGCILKDAYQGILVGKDSSSPAVRNFISMNIIRDMSDYGIVEGAGGQSNFNLFIYNNMVNCRVPGIQRQGTNTIYEKNQGHRTDAKGTATFDISTGTSLVVNHTIFTTPSNIILTGTDLETSRAWVSNITSSTFTINLPSAVTANGRNIFWKAEF